MGAGPPAMASAGIRATRPSCAVRAGHVPSRRVSGDCVRSRRPAPAARALRVSHCLWGEAAAEPPTPQQATACAGSLLCRLVSARTAVAFGDVCKAGGGRKSQAQRSPKPFKFHFEGHCGLLEPMNCNRIVIKVSILCGLLEDGSDVAEILCQKRRMFAIALKTTTVWEQHPRPTARPQPRVQTQLPGNIGWNRLELVTGQISSLLILPTPRACGTCTTV